MRSVRRIALISGIILSCVSCDQLTKRVATAALEGRPSVSLACDTIRLSYAENAGAFLSLGEGLPRQARFWIFLLFPAMALSGLLVVALRRHLPGRLEVIALSLLVAGGMGNMVDRFLYGVVRDFLNVGIGSLRTGVFNVADVSIMLGATLLLLARSGAVRSHRSA